MDAVSGSASRSLLIAGHSPGIVRPSTMAVRYRPVPPTMSSRAPLLTTDVRAEAMSSTNRATV